MLAVDHAQGVLLNEDGRAANQRAAHADAHLLAFPPFAVVKQAVKAGLPAVRLFRGVLDKFHGCIVGH